MIRRLGLVSALVGLGLAASATPAAASVTIGQLAPGSPPPAICNTESFDLLQQTVTSGNTYVVPASGGITSWNISSWSTNAAAVAGQKYTMKVFRKVAEPASYVVVGHDGPRDLTSGALNRFPASVQVKPGDVLGFNDNDGSAVDNACDFGAPNDFGLFFLGGSLADGQMGTFTQQTEGGGFRLNVTAEVNPTNSFSLGSIIRNKKKGTATITINDIPNPGELTGSGKGVKVASTAVTSKTVTSGEAKLTIKAKGKKKRKLNETGKVKVKPKITYTPTGGDPRSQSVKVKLKKKL
jgi:hypothetical protein